MTEKRAFSAGAAAIFGVCCLGVWLWWACWRPVTTFLIVRHADRLDTQDALSDAGTVRAQELVHAASKAAIAAIYCSDTNRSRQTAQPLASALGLTPIVLPAEPADAWVEHALSHHRGRTVLLVGHSNTVPQIIAAAGGPTLPNLPDAEFDNFFVLQACRCRWRAAKLLNLEYGAVSPSPNPR